MMIRKWLKDNWISLVVLAVAAGLFFGARVWVRPAEEAGVKATEYAEYEAGTVEEILTDSTEADPVADGGYRGEQLMTVKVTSGQYAGETLLVYNYVGPLYGGPLESGDGVTMVISTYEDGSHRATVYEYNRAGALAVVLAAFLLITAVVGGKTGIKSILGLGVTVLALFYVLIPAFMKGADIVLTTFVVCSGVAVVCFVILGGVTKKTVGAALGTIAGMAAAAMFALLAQKLARISGLRVPEVEPLLQLRQTGTPIGLKGLLTGGIIVAALGAVMDVSMSISSALQEVHLANPALSRRELFRSGMNIGRDMVGTMTNTLILATIGSGFVLIIYLYTLGLSKYQLLSSSYLSIEVISGLAGSTGVILSIPLTAAISAGLYGKQ